MTPRTRWPFLIVKHLAKLKTLPVTRERPVPKVKRKFGRFMGINASISASRENTGECDFTVRTTGVFLYFQIISFAAQVSVASSSEASIYDRNKTLLCFSSSRVF